LRLCRNRRANHEGTVADNHHAGLRMPYGTSQEKEGRGEQDEEATPGAHTAPPYY
jgi:hypothetical protein